MLQKYDIFKGVSKWAVLRPFFDDPAAYIGLRETSRLTGLSTPSISLHLNSFVKDGILVRLYAKKTGLKRRQPAYKANRDNESFRYLKKLNTINLLHTTVLLEHLFNKCQPDVIILFGSASKGEDVAESDIDLYLQCPEKEINLAKFESLFKRKIQLHFRLDFNKIPTELKNSILNGIILDGYLKIP